MLRNRLAGTLLALWVVVGCANRAAPPTVETPPTPAVDVGPRVGNRAHAFSLENTDGGAVSLESYRGKPVVLVFYRGKW
ncbi:redoxin domain-containing protein [Candidatus Poribacteria bacterium]|nr:redoxin domain-containing protein [Candidatus Poribacteria bacterium]